MTFVSYRFFGPDLTIRIRPCPALCAYICNLEDTKHRHSGKISRTFCYILLSIYGFHFGPFPEKRVTWRKIGTWPESFCCHLTSSAPRSKIIIKPRTKRNRKMWRCSILNKAQFGLIVSPRNNGKREILKRTEVAIIDLLNIL